MASLNHSAMRTSRFDVVTSFLLSCVYLLASVVGVLLCLWLLSEQDKPPIGLVDPARVTVASYHGVVDNDFIQPLEEEVRDLEELPIDVTLEQLATIATEVAATSLSDSINEDAGLPSGPDGDDFRLGEDVVPRFERWKLVFSAKTPARYARLLDHFGIELGAVGGSVQAVDFVSNFSSRPIVRHVLDTEREPRLYFVWTDDTPLKGFDRQLLRQADVDLAGRQVLMFIPSELEGHLARTEFQHAMSNGHKSVDEIATTTFEAVENADGFTFRVIQQRYR